VHRAVLPDVRAEHDLVAETDEAAAVADAVGIVAARMRVADSRAEIGEEAGAAGRTVADPWLDAQSRVRPGEDQPAVRQRAAEQGGRDGGGVEVTDPKSAGRRAVGPPQAGVAALAPPEVQQAAGCGLSAKVDRPRIARAAVLEVREGGSV
jgi:hypothetical protein